jgi:hypothetical protein
MLLSSKLLTQQESNPAAQTYIRNTSLKNGLRGPAALFPVKTVLKRKQTGEGVCKVYKKDAALMRNGPKSALEIEAGKGKCWG